MKYFSKLIVTGLVISIISTGFSDELDEFIWKAPAPAKITDLTKPIQTQLEARVKEIVEGGHFSPGYFRVGLSSGRSGDFLWTSADELVLTLSMALPYLSDELKKKTITYMQQEITSYPPFVMARYDRPLEKMAVPPTWTNIKRQTSDNSTDPFHAGIRREPFPVPKKVLQKVPNVWPPQRVGLNVIYTMWLFANNTGDERFMGHCWPEAENLYMKYLGQKKMKPDKVVRLPEISGLIGLARIAKATDRDEIADKVAAEAKACLQQLDFDALFKADRKAFKQGHNWTVPFFLTDLNAGKSGIFNLHYSRELARYLKANQQDKVNKYLTSVFARQPLWHLTKGFNAISFGGTDGSGSGENSHFRPEIATSLFFLHAYTMGKTQEELIDLLDYPSMKGDLCHITKLVATIEAQKK